MDMGMAGEVDGMGITAEIVEVIIHIIPAILITLITQPLFFQHLS
jgi:hypothetical protein